MPRKPASIGGLSAPFHGVRVLAIVLLPAIGAAFLSLGAMPALLGGTLFAAGAYLAASDWRRLKRLQRLAAELSADNPHTPATLAQALDGIARRLSLIGHRSDTRNPATGLPTREHLFERIDADLTAGSKALLGVVRMADYDRVAAFDQEDAARSLAGFAQRLQAAIGDRHILAQVDRDCFAIWFGAVETETALRELRALGYVAGQDITTRATQIAPTVEIGKAIAEGKANAEQLLASALASLRRVVGQGGGGDSRAQDMPLEDMQEQFLIEQDLERAIETDQLSVRYQPLVDLELGRLVGAEALLRWDHPSLGAISPARFIPIVEAVGLSDRYGLWVLDTACRQIRLWQDSGLRGLKVAVNLSATQLHDEALPVKIGRTLARHGIEPSALELELTETAAMADIDRTRALFASLRGMGLSIAIDDFGSGYSSLSYLKNLSFDKLKIDREFVTQVDEQRDSHAICRALIELGRGLGLVVLAEGVETAREVQSLRELGCKLFQGFYFAAPQEGTALFNLACDRTWLASLRSPVRHQILELERRMSA